MRSEAAWAAASRRAGAFFLLPPEGEAPAAAAAAGGVEIGDEARFDSLRDFSAGVQLVSPGRTDEFFRSPATPPSQADTASALPPAEFVPFNSAGLQALLAEGCLFGWLLWGSESNARAQLGSLGEQVVSALFIPPLRGPGD